MNNSGSFSQNGDGPSDLSMPALLRTDGLTLHYGDKTALQNVSLWIVRNASPR